MPRPASLLRSLGLAVLAVALPVGLAAQAADAVTVTTPYPAVVADPGGTARFPLTIDARSAGTVALEATGVPAGWTTSFRGGGSIVSAVYVDGGKAATVDLEVKVPSDAAPGSHRIGVRANDGRGGSGNLAVEIRVSDASAGGVKLEATYPTLKGPASATYRFRSDAQQRHQPAADLHPAGLGTDRLDGRRAAIELEPGGHGRRRRRQLDPDPGDGPAARPTRRRAPIPSPSRPSAARPSPTPTWPSRSWAATR